MTNPTSQPTEPKVLVYYCSFAEARVLHELLEGEAYRLSAGWHQSDLFRLLLHKRRLNQKGKFRATTLIHFQLLHKGRNVYNIKTRGLSNPSGMALWPNG